MATELGVGYVTILPSMRGFTPALNAGLSGPMTAAGQKSGSNFGSALLGTVGKVVKAGSIGATIFGGIALKSGLDRLTTIQNATQSLTTIMGDAGKAAALMGQIKKTVQGTPFNLDQFADAGKNLVAMNIAGAKVPGILTAIGDAAATSGKGGEGLSQLVDVFGKMAAQGQVSLDQVWSISAAGVPALQILANGFHTTTDDMKDLISNGAVPAGKAIDILTQGIEHGSKGAAGSTVALGGAMAGLRQTFTGAFGGMKAAVARFGAAVLGPFVPLMTNAFTGSGEFLDKVSKRVTPVMERAATAIASLWAGLSGSKFAGTGKPLDAWVAKGESVRRVVGRIRDGVVGLYALLVKGDFTSAFSRAFGVQEDSPVVDYMFKIRDAVGQVVTAFRSVDFSSVQSALSGTGNAFSQIGNVFTTVKENAAVLKPAVQDLGTAMAGAAAGGGVILSNLLHIAAGVLGFFADHTGLATAAILAITAAMVASGPISEAYRLAYVIRTPLIVAQTIVSWANTRALKANTITTAENTLAQNGAAAATKKWTVMSALFHPVQFAKSLVTGGNTAATNANAAATGRASLATRIWSLVTKTAGLVAKGFGIALRFMMGPVGWIIAGIALLVTGLVLFFTKTKTGRAIITAAWNGIKAAVGKVVDWFKGSVLPALTSVWDGIVAGAKWLWKTLQPVFGFIADHWRIVISFMLGPIGILIAYWHQLVAAAKWLWGVLGPIFATIGKIVYAVIGGIVLAHIWLLKQAWKVLWTSVKAVWNFAAPIFAAIGKIIYAIFGGIVLLSIKTFMVAWKVLWAATKASWTYVGKPIFDAIGTAVGWLWRNVIEPTWTLIKLEFKALWAAVSWAWTNVGKPIFDGIGTAISWVWSHVIAPTWDAAKLAFSLLWSGVKAAWDTIGHPVFDAIGASIAFVWNKVIKPTFDAISSAWSGLWGGLKDAFSAVWDGVKNAIIAGVNAVIGLINTFLTGINFILSKLPGNFKIGLITPIGGGKPAQGGQASGGRQAGPQTFATGGWVPTGMPISPYARGRDTVDAVLQPGEHVTRESRAKRYPGWLTAINDGSYNGPDLPRYYANGGQVTGMFNLVRSKFPLANLNSGFRAGADDYHGQGKAIDLGKRGVAGGAGNSYLAAMNTWLYDTYGKSTLELIYDGLGDNRPDVKNGGPYTYSAGLQAQHRNHVHWAIDSLASLATNAQLGGSLPTGGSGFSLTDPVAAAKSAMDLLTTPLKAGIGKLPDGFIRNFANGAVDKVTELVTGLIGSVFGGGSKTSSGTGLDSWIAQALGITKTPASWAPGLRTLIGRESGGDPFAINNSDINARNGDPSRGLMQLIGATFASYRDTSLVNDIFDPIANIVAGINYIKARYGDISRVQQANPNLPPKGYDSGGLLAPGPTLTMNRTGVPEAVLTASQWSTMAAIAAGAGESQDDVLVERIDRLERALVDATDRLGDRYGEEFRRDTDRIKLAAGNRPASRVR